MFEAELLVSEINKLAVTLPVCIDASCITKLLVPVDSGGSNWSLNPFLNLQLESREGQLDSAGVRMLVSICYRVPVT
jgi:hypothetical protein